MAHSHFDYICSFYKGLGTHQAKPRGTVQDSERNRVQDSCEAKALVSRKCMGPTLPERQSRSRKGTVSGKQPALTLEITIEQRA